MERVFQMHKGKPIRSHYCNYTHFLKVSILYNLIVRLKFPSVCIPTVWLQEQSADVFNFPSKYPYRKSEFSNVLVMTKFSLLKSQCLGRIGGFVLLNILLLLGLTSPHERNEEFYCLVLRERFSGNWKHAKYGI